MLDLLFDHTAAFLAGELILAASLATFAFALVGAVRERYSERYPIRVRASARRSRLGL